MEVANDLLLLFLKHKIDKETLKTILKIHKIPFSVFNDLVRELVDEFRSTQSPVLKLDDMLDNRFKKEIVQLKSSEAKTSTVSSGFLLDKRLDLDQVHRSVGYLTYSSAKRLLNVDELSSKAKDYFKALGTDISIQEESIALFVKSLEFFLKNTFDSCGDKIDLKRIKEVLMKHLKVLNL